MGKVLKKIVKNTISKTNRKRVVKKNTILKINHTQRLDQLVTYSAGWIIVREKCSQNYNTSSAEECQAQAIFRRQHPVLASENAGSFEHMFAKKQQKSKPTVAQPDGKVSATSVSKSTDDFKLKKLFALGIELLDHIIETVVILPSTDIMSLPTTDDIILPTTEVMVQNTDVLCF